MIRKYDKLPKCWKKVVARYDTVRWLWLSYENKKDDQHAMNYFLEMEGIRETAKLCNIDIYSCHQDFKKLVPSSYYQEEK